MKEQFVEEYRLYGARLKKNLVFGNADGYALKMDLIYSDKRSELPSPVLVWIHGGAWSDHELDRNYRPEVELLRFAAKGYVVACIDYRLSDEAPFPAQIQDCKCAIRFLRAHAKTWNLDPERIGVWGESAGGHLVNLLGSTQGREELEGASGWQEYSSHVNAVCTWYSPVDIRNMELSEGSILDALLGHPCEQERDQKVQAANPISYLHPNMPPFLIMHGSADPLVPIEQSRILYQRLIEMGCSAELHIMDGQGHGFFQGAEAYQYVNDFFDTHLLIH